METTSFNVWAASCISKTPNTPAIRLDQLLDMASRWCERNGLKLDLGKIQFSRALADLGYSRGASKGRTTYRGMAVDENAKLSAVVDGPGSDRMLSATEAAIWLAGRWKTSVSTFARVRRWITHGYVTRTDRRVERLEAVGWNSCAIKLGDLTAFVEMIEADLESAKVAR